MRCFLITLIFTSFLFSSQTKACIGPGENFNVSFKNGEQPDELIAVLTKNPDSTNSETVTTELLDDTGYIGLHLTLSYLAIDSRDKKIDTANNKELIEFMKNQLNVFKKSITQYASEYQNLIIIPIIDKYIKSLKTGVKINDLVTLQNYLDQALYDNKIEITAKQRAVGGQWQAETPIKKLKLPTYLLMRGCNSTISSFNVRRPSNNQKPSKLPSFGTSGTR